MSTSYCDAYDYERAHGVLPPVEVATPVPPANDKPAEVVETKVLTAPAPPRASASGADVKTG
jgi:hypothetical protein